MTRTSPLARGACEHCGAATLGAYAGQAPRFCRSCSQSVRAIERGHRNVFSDTHPDLDVRRFFSKVLVAGPNECWTWDAGLNAHGYAHFLAAGKMIRGHRWIYERLVRPVPSGLVLDHLCRNRACVNPAHLDVVTRRENNLRGISPAAANAIKTHCKRGHELAGENLYVTNAGNRKCRTCHKANCRRWHERARAEA